MNKTPIHFTKMQIRIINFIYIGLFSVLQLPNGYAQKIFNGKNLEGWEIKGGKAKYEVIDGQIVGTTPSDTANTFLCTKEQYGDFVLELELKATENMNGGIQIRSESKANYRNGRVHGYQVEVDASKRAWSGGIFDEARRGWLYPLDLNPKAQQAYKPSDWNHYRIECIGHSIRTWVNGVAVAHVMDNLTPKGFIALQVHLPRNPQEIGTQIRWRNIKLQTKNIKQMPFEDIRVANFIPNQMSESEKTQGWKFLFDGQNTQHFRGVNQDKMPDKRWVITNGELQVEPSNGGETGNDIVTREEFGAFELVFDFKLSEKANSGIKYFVNEKYDTQGKSGIGLEFQLLDDDKHPDAKNGVVGNRTLASLYDLIPAEKPRTAIKKIGEWNQGRIVVYPDNRVEHYLNGQKVVEYTRGNNIYRALVAHSKYKDWKGFGLQPQGPILLQDHGDNVSFRSIKIKNFIVNN